jgi:hypothetical protein
MIRLFHLFHFTNLPPVDALLAFGNQGYGAFNANL